MNYDRYSYFNCNCMRRFFLFVFALMLSVNVMRAEIYSGNCGSEDDNVKWTLNTETGVLEIIGTGAMANYRSSAAPCPAPYSRYRGYITSVIISDGVTRIGNLAFAYCVKLSKITIPNSVTSIGESAFAQCGLIYLKIPNSVTSVEWNAFYGVFCVEYDGNSSVLGWDPGYSYLGYAEGDFCYAKKDSTNLLCYIGVDDSITIPSSVMSINNRAFEKCKNITFINIASDNPNFCAVDGVLFNKDTTTLIYYPCGRQGVYTIPNSVTSIGQRAFYNCSGLTSVSIPNTVASIGENAFYKVLCIIYTGDVEGSPWGALYINKFVDGDFVYADDSKTNLVGYRPSAKGDIVIPNGVKMISNSAFFKCTGINSISIPNSVVSIGESAFGNCNNLATVTIGNGVTSVGI